KHIVAAYRFELGKVTRMEIRERVVGLLNQVDHELATLVAKGVGVAPPEEATANHGRSSRFLSQTVLPGEGIATRKVAVLVADGVDAAAVEAVTAALTARGAQPEILAALDGTVATADGGSLPVTRSMTTMASVLYDAVVVPGGEASADAVAADGFARHFIAEAYKHAKPVAATGAGRSVLTAAGLPGSAPGLVVHEGDGAPPDSFATDLIAAIAAHRHHDRDVDAIAA
ncbi:MAG TPA: DJ-1/PfpI family protein, partial [Phytomonospora sp.]